MSFDKIKAMKSAERFLAQGKLRAAIGEYKRVVEDNPKDFSTLNIMGDLYVKNSENHEAVNCFRTVAEHYYGQGFANKAIAIYNKIARLQPDSIEAAEKLGHLYQMRGSYAEAREQYTRLADEYQKQGKKLEALEVWKRIAELDPNNTEVYLAIGKACIQENQKSDAVDAFAEAGFRFNSQERFEQAVAAFSKALMIQSNDIKALKGFVAAKIRLGCADEAAEALEKVLADNQYNREVLMLLIDCYLDMNAPAKAEATVVKLVQQEPSNFPKFLQIVKVYMNENDLESSVRALSISFEHVLGAGHSEEFLGWINEILARNPEYLEALRLLVKYHTWHRDGVEIRKSLERLAETARANEAVEDERFALGQLTAMSPLQPEYAMRLDELKAKYGLSDVPTVSPAVSEIPEFESFVALNEDSDTSAEYSNNIERFEHYTGDFDFADSSVIEAAEIAEIGEIEPDPDFYKTDPDLSLAVESIEVEEIQSFELTEPERSTGVNLSDELRLQKEIESVEFYIDQGYNDLALKCLDALRDEFGDIAKFNEMRRGILGFDMPEPDQNADTQTESSLQNGQAEPAHSVVENESVEMVSGELNVFEQFRNDLGLEDADDGGEGDYSTLYHTGIAYKEMGLMEDAIKDFQDAINMVKIDDGTRRYFQCANLLGHCFMMKGMPHLAQTWFKRALETSDLHDEEIQALNYELAVSYEASGEKDKAFAYFEQVYALDVDYRDIGQRIQNLRESYSSSMIN